MHGRILGTLMVAAAIFLAACAHPAAIAPSAAIVSGAPEELPPLDHGVYVADGFCIGSEYGCTSEPWRATGPNEVHERVDPASPVIATLAVGDLAWPIGGQLRFAPHRGIVNSAVDFGEVGRLEVGDIVYMLEPEGEGTYGIWHRGHRLSSTWGEGDDNEPITWDAEPAPLQAGAITGEWVRFRLRDGRTGWVVDGSFECAVDWCGPPERR